MTPDQFFIYTHPLPICLSLQYMVSTEMVDISFLYSIFYLFPFLLAFFLSKNSLRNRGIYVLEYERQARASDSKVCSSWFSFQLFAFFFPFSILCSCFFLSHRRCLTRSSMSASKVNFKRNSVEKVTTFLRES
ncbi:hypothetical protein EDC01DRAFT_449445 [Geopyxis carbonaria]|nr:hypothetical protein EDC01DRAFT_449445 [Geopyxis carbonaria]